MLMVFGFYYQKNITSEFTRIEFLDHYVWENIRGQSHISSRTEDIAELMEMLQMTLLCAYKMTKYFGKNLL